MSLAPAELSRNWFDAWEEPIVIGMLTSMDGTTLGVSATTSLQQAASAYVTAGFHVLPLRPREKKPLILGGWNAASASIEQCETWWQSNPWANIGITPGFSGLVVLDIDGPDLVEIIKQTPELGLSWDMPTPITKTPGRGGGYHFWFSLPGGRGVKSGTFAFGRTGKPTARIEYISLRKYVVAPPSLHPDGGSYISYRQSAWIMPVPDIILSFIRKSGGLTVNVNSTTVKDTPANTSVGETTELPTDESQETAGLSCIVVKSVFAHNSPKEISAENQDWVVRLSHKLGEMESGNRHNWTRNQLLEIMNTEGIDYQWATETLLTGWKKTMERTGEQVKDYLPEYRGMVHWVVEKKLEDGSFSRPS